MPRVPKVLLAILLQASAVPAFGEAPPRRGPPPATDFTLTAAVVPTFAPVFVGSRDYGLSLFPDIRFAYRDRLVASVSEGVSYALHAGAGASAGPIVRLRFGRDEHRGGSPFLVAGASTALRGLGDVDPAMEIGAFAQQILGPMRFRLEVRRGVGGHAGVLVDASLAWSHRLGPLSLSFGPRSTWASAPYLDAFFGVDEAAAGRTGLAPYQPRSSIVSWGAGGAVVMPLTQSLALTLFGGLDRLGAEVAGSPLVRERGDPTQATVGLAIGYRIGWNRD